MCVHIWPDQPQYSALFVATNHNGAHWTSNNTIFVIRTGALQAMHFIVSWDAFLSGLTQFGRCWDVDPCGRVTRHASVNYVTIYSGNWLVPGTDDKSLPEAMTYFQLDPKGQISLKFESKQEHFPTQNNATAKITPIFCRLNDYWFEMKVNTICITHFQTTMSMNIYAAA